MTKTEDFKYSVSYIPTIKINHNCLVQYWTKVESAPRYRNTYANFYGGQGNRIVVYDDINFPPGTFFAGDDEYLFNEEIRLATKKTPYSGEITAGARKRLKEACELMIEVTEEYSYYDRKQKRRVTYKIGFLTVTLSSGQDSVSDKDIKKHLLQPFIRKLRKFGLKNYIWKAERQQNGNIHFHLFVDAFLPHEQVKNIWNKLQSKFHFMREFADKWGHHDPNSTDIVPLEDSNGAVAYMLKYMLKACEKETEEKYENEGKKGTEGKVWDCSLALKEKNDTGEFATDKEHEQIEQAIGSGNLKEIKTDFARIFIYVPKDRRRILPESLMNRYDKYISRVKAKAREPD